MAKKKTPNVFRKKKATAKNPGGRPTKYSPKVKVQARILAEKGFTDEEMAEVFDVSKQTINNWKKQFPGFFDSIKEGKDIADQKVVMSLYERACGYSHPEVHFSEHKGTVTKTPHIKHYAPDPTSCIFWLKNRQPDQWRDKTETEVKIKHPAPMTIKETEDLLARLKKSGTGIDYG